MTAVTTKQRVEELRQLMYGLVVSEEYDEAHLIELINRVHTLPHDSARDQLQDELVERLRLYRIEQAQLKP